jgi:hypothetical protein
MAQNGSRYQKKKEDDDDTPHRLSDCNLVHVRGSEKPRKVRRLPRNVQCQIVIKFFFFAFFSVLEASFFRPHIIDSEVKRKLLPKL